MAPLNKCDAHSLRLMARICLSSMDRLVTLLDMLPDAVVVNLLSMEALRAMADAAVNHADRLHNAAEDLALLRVSTAESASQAKSEAAWAADPAFKDQIK